jgi:hypothetical protein
MPYLKKLTLRPFSHLTGAKFKPHIFVCVSGFALSYVANICVLMILYEFCVLPATFCYIIIKMQFISGLSLHLLHELRQRLQ